MSRLILLLATVVFVAGCARQRHAPSTEDSGVLMIEEAPRPLLPEPAWDQLTRGMRESEVEKLLGQPDSVTSPLTWTSPGVYYVNRDGKEQRFTTRPTTCTTGSTEWQYARPTSAAPDVIYTIRFSDEHRVTVFWQTRTPLTTQP
jgi:hypothetical protein